MVEGLAVFCPERKRPENARVASRNLWACAARRGACLPQERADPRRGRSSMGARAGWLQKELSMKNYPIMGVLSETRGPQTVTSPLLLAPGHSVRLTLSQGGA